MRKSLGVLLFGVGVLAGYALPTVPATAQTPALPFTIGASVRLTVENFPSGVSTIACTVSGVHNEFIGCEGDGRERPPRWINVRYVQEIRPAPER
jgi:hypothetical protein